MMNDQLTRLPLSLPSLDGGGWEGGDAAMTASSMMLSADTLLIQTMLSSLALLPSS